MIKSYNLNPTIGMCCHSKSTIIHSDESIVNLLILMTTNFVPGNRDLAAGVVMSAKPPHDLTNTKFF